MEYVTGQDLDEYGMQIMHVLDEHLKLITALTQQNSKWCELIGGLLNTVEDLQARVRELETITDESVDGDDIYE